MSFFQDIPPPLDDDKTRDVDDYDLDDDNVSRISTDISEIPNNTNSLYNSSIIKPPELSAALFFDEPPPDDDYDPLKISREDSFEDFVYHENSPDPISESSVQGNNINTVIDEFVDVKTIEHVINDVESKLSQLQEHPVDILDENVVKSEIDETSRALKIDHVSDDELKVQGPGELILSPEESNLSVSLDEPINEIINDEKSDVGAISSFSTSLTCDDDKIVMDNLHSTHDEEIMVEKINQNLTECPQDAFQFNYDDDDDFNDFETAIPVHRTIETQSSVTSFEAPQDEFRFEADFSAFNEQTENDDDFGDFNDFETAPMASNDVKQLEHSIEFVKPSNVGGLIGDMFPKDEEINEPLESNEIHENMKHDEIVKKLDDFEATLALCYHYNNSSASQILVKALGIDTRNILFGAQWGNSSSSSNMPRFASNLSFNPLEPLKSASSANSSNNAENVDMKILAPQPAKDITTVPDVKFDWNSSGLVNPLDGKQPNAQQSDESSKVPSTAAVFQSTSPITVASKHPIENDHSNALDEEEMTQPEGESSAAIGNELNLAKFSSFQAATTSNSILVRERTIKLPETHIFTPVKSTSPVAREVISRDGSPSTIIVKEYHDVEYLEPKRKDLESDFDDFQSATVEPVLMPKPSILEPQRVENKSSTILWPNPGQIIDDFSFMEIPNDKKETKNEQPSFNDFKPSTKNRELPVIGNSPSKQPSSTVEDDDFADFQAAPIIPMPNQNINSYQAGKNEQLTLSPSKLVSSMKNQGITSQKPSWITSMDDDEVSRIEAAFPKCKVSPKPQPKTNNDEDDWSDFVGVPSTQQQINNQPVLNHQKSDDWSDFISVPPVAPIATVNSISSQMLSKPNFTSWNQPVSRPYVHHATSFLSSEPKDFNYGQRMNITNNFNYQQNGISTILPDLDFAMPRSFNLPRSSNESSGKK